MTTDAKRFVCAATGVGNARAVETIQELWSGYGSIVRYELTQSSVRADEAPKSEKTIILKHVNPPPAPKHARGWASDTSHMRKLKSYKVEAEFYRAYAPHLAGSARVPALLSAETRGDDGERYLALEDLDAAGYPLRMNRLDVDDKHVRACLLWLARFHGTFLSCSKTALPGLWETGCYWHLETRPDELQAMPDSALKGAASAIDDKLARCEWKTIVHGDAKLANFCFPPTGSAQEKEGDVAAVDFQYCGGGAGVRDVAYLLGSCMDEAVLERDADQLLAAYFAELRAVASGVSAANLDAVQAEWTALWEWAVADFQRFLAGWAPGHWKMNGYSARIADAVALRCLP